MISKKQLLANRSNCLKSTGPRTMEGKRTVSQNAVRHGLLSNSDEILISGENQGEFDSFRQNLLINLAPHDQLETLLVERITGFFWKLKRAGRMEKGLLEILCTQPANPADAGKKGSIPFEIIIRKAEDRDNDPDYQEFLKSRQSKTADPCSSPSPQETADKMPQEPAEIPVMSPRQHSQMLGRVVQQDFSSGRLLERLLTYEGRIESHLYRALTELQKFQFIRKTNKAISNDDEAEVASNDLNDNPKLTEGKSAEASAKEDKAISNVDEASVLHDNNDQNKLASNTGHPESPLRGQQPVDSISSNKSVQSACPRTSLSGVQFYASGTVVPVSLEPPKPNKAISNVAEASSLRDENTQNKSNLQAQSVSEGIIGIASHSERSEESLINSSAKSVQSVVPVLPQTEKTNEAISNVDEASVLHDNNDRNKLASNTGHPPKPLAEGGVDNRLCTLHAVRRSTCGCL